MSTIKIEISVDSNDSNFNAVLEALMNTSKKSAIGFDIVQPEDVKAEAPKKRTSAPKKVQADPAIEKQQIEDEQENDILGETKEEEETISYDDLKELLAKKVTANRDAIVKRLKELGGTKISDLPKENYQALYDFMANLK